MFNRVRTEFGGDAARPAFLVQYIDYVFENFQGKLDVYQGLCTNFLMFVMMRKVPICSIYRPNI